MLIYSGHLLYFMIQWLKYEKSLLERVLKFILKIHSRACLEIALCQPCVTVCTQGYDMEDLFRMRAL